MLARTARSPVSHGGIASLPFQELQWGRTSFDVELLVPV